jgi:hypothetical protein
MYMANEKEAENNLMKGTKSHQQRQVCEDIYVLVLTCTVNSLEVEGHWLDYSRRILRLLITEVLVEDVDDEV